MVQDNETVDKWAIVIDDSPSSFVADRTESEQIEYEKEKRRILGSIDFDNI